MTLRNPGRLAIHRRSDEIAFLRYLLGVLGDVQISYEVGESKKNALESVAGDPRAQHSATADERDLQIEVLVREHDLADELLHTRQTEPLGETLQRRLAMAELICHDLALRAESLPESATHPADPRRSVAPRADSTGRECVQGEQSGEPEQADRRGLLPDAYWLAEIERRALAEMLDQWWAWLRKS